VTGFYGLLSTAGSVTWGTLAVAYGLVLPGFIPLTGTSARAPHAD